MLSRAQKRFIMEIIDIYTICNVLYSIVRECACSRAHTVSHASMARDRQRAQYAIFSFISFVG